MWWLSVLLSVCLLEVGVCSSTEDTADSLAPSSVEPDLYWGDSVVQVVHFPLHRQPSFAGFNDYELVKFAKQEPKENKYLARELRDQMLAGWFLRENVKVCDLSGDVLSMKGVRANQEKLMRKPFVSLDLERLLAFIPIALREHRDMPFEAKDNWLRMGSRGLTERLYPESHTRQWLVIDGKDVKQKSSEDRVCIVFKGESFALEGKLCARKRSSVDSHVSLLALKRKSAAGSGAANGGFALLKTPTMTMPL